MCLYIMDIWSFLLHVLPFFSNMQLTLTSSGFMTTSWVFLQCRLNAIALENGGTVSGQLSQRNSCFSLRGVINLYTNPPSSRPSAPWSSSFNNCNFLSKNLRTKRPFSTFLADSAKVSKSPGILLRTVEEFLANPIRSTSSLPVAMMTWNDAKRKSL